MPRYIKDEDGRFAGSVGDGIVPPSAANMDIIWENDGGKGIANIFENAEFDLSDGFSHHDVAGLAKKGILALGASVLVFGGAAATASPASAAQPTSISASSVMASQPFEGKVIIDATPRCVKAQNKEAKWETRVSSAETKKARKQARKQAAKWEKRVAERCETSDVAAYRPGDPATSQAQVAAFLSQYPWAKDHPHAERLLDGKGMGTLGYKFPDGFRVIALEPVKNSPLAFWVVTVDENGKQVGDIVHDKGRNVGYSQTFDGKHGATSFRDLEVREREYKGVKYNDFFLNGEKVAGLMNVNV